MAIPDWATYTTYGNVRGHCDHRHKTVDTATACLHRDQQGCKKVGGYSDRHVYWIDQVGALRQLDADDDTLGGPAAPGFF